MIVDIFNAVKEVVRRGSVKITSIRMQQQMTTNHIFHNIQVTFDLRDLINGIVIKFVESNLFL